VGHWDYQAVEMLAGETPAQVLAALPKTHGFHENGVFEFDTVRWLHVGWSDANAVAYRALAAFCQQTGRRWITSYATDLQAFLDDRYFGDHPPERAQRLTAVFGPPATEAREAERDPTLQKEPA
jgi:hypothetical protein